MHDLLMKFIPLVAAFIEFCGIGVIIISVLKEMYNIFIRYRLNFMDFEKDTTMNHGLATALEILLGAEILKTIAYRDIRQLVEVAALIIIRVFITVLIHWEMNHKLKHKEKELYDKKIENEERRIGEDPSKYEQIRKNIKEELH